MSLRTESLRCVGFVTAFAASLSVGATALAQPQGQGQNVSQDGTSRAGSRNVGAADGPEQPGLAHQIVQTRAALLGELGGVIPQASLGTAGANRRVGAELADVCGTERLRAGGADDEHGDDEHQH